MEKLVEYTGGIFFITLATTILNLIFCAFALIAIVSSIIKNREINNARKVEYIILIIAISIVAAGIGGTIGYYSGIFELL